MSTDSAQSASSLYHSDVEPIRLDYERNWADEFDSPEFYSDYGFVVRATADTGEDVHLCVPLAPVHGAVPRRHDAVRCLRNIRLLLSIARHSRVYAYQ